MSISSRSDSEPERESDSMDSSEHSLCDLEAQEREKKMEGNDKGKKRKREKNRFSPELAAFLVSYAADR